MYIVVPNASHTFTGKQKLTINQFHTVISSNINTLTFYNIRFTEQDIIDIDTLVTAVYTYYTISCRDSSHS